VSSDQGRDYLKENKLLPEIAALLKAEIDVRILIIKSKSK
jgi:hypothetical protein